MVDGEAERTRWGRLKELGARLQRHNVLAAASAMAFHGFFSLVPLLALTGWVAHELALSGEHFMAPLVRLAPTAVGNLTGQELVRLTADAGAVAPLSIAGFLWLASGYVATAMRVFEQLFETQRRSFLRMRLLSLAFALVAVTVLLLTTAAAFFAVWLGSTAARIAGVAAPMLALWLLVAGFFRFSTMRAPKSRRVGFRGAAVTLILWIGASGLFSAYVTQLGNYTRFYGGLAAMVVLLLWLWLMSFALLIGGAVNALLESDQTA